MRHALAACFLLAPLLAQADDTFFVPAATPDRLSMSLEAATGSRDAGSMGRDGEEGLANLHYSPAEDWALEAGAGYAHNDVRDRNEQRYTVEARYQGLPGGFGLGGGYRYDYDQVSIPFARLMWRSDSPAYPLGISALLEFPRASDRDATDVLLSAAQGLPCGDRLRCAIELAGEDLEGFWEPEEAEGGAKIVLGPTVSWHWAQDRQFNLFAGWIHAATANVPTRPGYPDYRSNRNGAMLRLALLFGAGEAD